VSIVVVCCWLAVIVVLDVWVYVTKDVFVAIIVDTAAGE